MVLLAVPFFLIWIGAQINMPVLYYIAVGCVVGLDITFSIWSRRMPDDDDNGCD